MGKMFELINNETTLTWCLCCTYRIIKEGCSEHTLCEWGWWTAWVPNDRLRVNQNHDLDHVPLMHRSFNFDSTTGVAKSTPKIQWRLGKNQWTPFPLQTSPPISKPTHPTAGSKPKPGARPAGPGAATRLGLPPSASHSGRTAADTPGFRRWTTRSAGLWAPSGAFAPAGTSGGADPQASPGCAGLRDVAARGTRARGSPSVSASSRGSCR